LFALSSPPARASAIRGKRKVGGDVQSGAFRQLRRVKTGGLTPEVIAQLGDLAALRDQGILTEEFQAPRARLLGKCRLVAGDSSSGAWCECSGVATRMGGSEPPIAVKRGIFHILVDSTV
jgi:hypothetical protein